MNSILKSTILGETLHVKKLPSGLSSYIIPKKGFNEKFASLAVSFGSCDLEFKVDNKSIVTPEGIAHFFEHKAFEDEKLDYFNEFTKLSGSVNAYTNFNSTVYYFSCTENFNECLKLLFDMVFSLYVTDETIEKEKGIIEQEISMYDDDPNWRVYFNMLQGLYENSPVKSEIAGSAESIAEIDLQMLKTIFHSFYTPCNMALICSGDFNLEEVYEIAHEKTKHINSPNTMKVYPAEPRRALKTHIEEKMHVAKPLFCLGFKDNHDMEDVYRLTSTRILLDIIMGGSSETYNKLYSAGLIDDGFGSDYSLGSCYSTIIFSGASKDPDAVFNEIMTAVKEAKTVGIDNVVFERIKKKHLGRYLNTFNSVSTPADMQADFFIKGFNVFDLIEALQNTTLDHVTERLINCFENDNFCLSVITEVN